MQETVFLALSKLCKFNDQRWSYELDSTIALHRNKLNLSICSKGRPTFYLSKRIALKLLKGKLFRVESYVQNAISLFTLL